MRNTLLLRLLLPALLAGLAPVAASTATHYATGTYIDSSRPVPVVLELHIEPDGTMTGTLSGLAEHPFLSGRRDYFDGTFLEDTGAGSVFQLDASVGINLRLSEGVLEAQLRFGSDEDSERLYLLRQPGPGPEAAFIAPQALLEERGDPGAVFARTEHAVLLLGDAYLIRDMLDLVMAEAGHAGDSSEFTWLMAAAHTFRQSPPELQARFEDNGSWWPQWQAEWHDADATARLEVALDLLVLTYSERVLGEAAAEDAGSRAGCDTAFECLVILLDEERLERARARAPCISLSGCASLESPAERHDVTGVFVRERADSRDLVLEIHVAEDGTLTGLYTGSGIYPFSGTYYEDGHGQGYFYMEHLLSTAFHLEFENGMISFMTYPGSPGEVPAEGYEPAYYVRRPGPGPAGPFIMPMHVLMNRGDRDAVVRRSSPAELQLRDAINFVGLLDLAMKEAGFTGSMPLSGDWVNRAANAFTHAPSDVQARMADSESWWPQLQEEWPQADAAARLELALDVLLMGFTETTVRDALQDGPADAGDCSHYYGCLAAIFDSDRLERTVSRQPCLSLSGCGSAGER